MDQTTINEIIHYLKESLINSGIKVDSIALFGSALSGDMHDESDLELTPNEIRDKKTI